eukprot:TRINITY_DN679_c0_g2_i1.p1 TRINITY_DN679_c0_g2~~TRINITY_DN679_c0_g2_i1.p1  ORF type:complete len:4462 (-),score=1316.63 TRINITY_DN679_c0_g2_i1:16-13401(-)
MATLAEADKRLEWLSARAQSVLGATDAQFKNMLVGDFSDNPNKKAVYEFLQTYQTRRLLLFMDSSEKTLQASQQPPPYHPKKTFYMIKSDVDKLLQSEKDMSELIMGDFTSAAMESLSQAVQEVYIPLMSNAESTERWPAVVQTDTVSSVHKFLANLCVMIGNTQGRTILPLPPGETPQPEKVTRDKDRMHVLESAVVTWTRQIKNVLKADSEADATQPGPLAEVSFWTDHSKNLNFICEQLQSEKIRKVIKILELTKNQYAPAFSRLVKDVETARMEANDNAIHLRPLRKLFQRLNTEPDFTAIVDLFIPMMHMILLVWKSSKSYNTAGRLVVLIREICNDIIQQAARYLDGVNLLKIRPEDAVEKVRTALRVCNAFKSIYFDYKARVATEVPARQWRIQNSALFARLDSFLERCHDVLYLLLTIVCFTKLDKVEIGGTKGRMLTTNVRQMYTDFLDWIRTFQNVTYDIMDVNARVFDDDFYAFRGHIKELERRIANIITQGFDDCATVDSAFKLFDTFSGVLDREIIQQDLERKQIELLRSYALDLKRVQETFVAFKDRPPIFANMPPTAGAVTWARGLQERISLPFERMKQLNRTVLEQEDAKEIISTYNSMIATLKEYERKLYGEWASDIDLSAQSRLKQTLLRVHEVDGRGLLVVNFDPSIVRLLREVKYLQMSGHPIPKSASDIFEQTEVFRTLTTHLEMLVNTFNNIVTSLLDVERPLLQSRLDEMDKTLDKGIKHLNWKSNAIKEFVTTGRAVVSDVDRVVQTIKSNVQEIERICARWQSSVLFDRQGNRTYSAEDFQSLHKSQLAVRYNEAQDDGLRIHALLLENNKVLKVSRGAAAWKAYVDYVRDIVVDGLRKTVVKALEALKNTVDPIVLQRQELNPLLVINLEFAQNDVRFRPALEESSDKSGVRDIVNGWIADFKRVAQLVKRLDTGEGDYFAEINEYPPIQQLVVDILAIVHANESKTIESRDAFTKFSELWKFDVNQAFASFLASGKSEYPDASGVTADGNPDHPPLLAYDMRIARYRRLQDDIGAIPTPTNIGWLRVDSKPIKNALKTSCDKWIFSYTSFLETNVRQNLTDLMNFIDKVTKGLDIFVRPGDRNALMTVLGHLATVRERQDRYDQMFEPLRQSAALLRKYEVDIHKGAQAMGIVQTLDAAPGTWTALKRKAVAIREKYSAMQSTEADKVRAHVLTFADTVIQFRTNFVRDAPFTFDKKSAGAYVKLDDWQRKMNGIKRDSQDLMSKQVLLDLSLNAFTPLKECEEEMQLLKNVWDMISFADSQFAEWTGARWDTINIDRLTDEAFDLLAIVQRIDKRVRAWNAFQGLESMVKNMKVALPLVQMLRSEALRDRHWKQLARVTGKPLPSDTNFKLSELLGLDLHDHADDVSQIVEKAKKELSFERNIDKLEQNWVSRVFTFVRLREYECPLLGKSDDLVEALETDQVMLQNMQADKRTNAHFTDEIGKWQKRLNMVDGVLTTWLNVQRRWSALQPIFYGADDIRTTLAAHYATFDVVNTEWIQLMRDAALVPNVVECCNREGLYGTLMRIDTDLEMCQKALNNYLEDKKMAFPRFYFVAPNVLLDILSKGSNPSAIQRHMIKLFDNISRLEFQRGGDGKPTKTVMGMYSQEDEYVPFIRPFICEGAVETWLNGLVDLMRESLRLQLKESIQAYLEMPREQWLLRYPAQIVLVTSQIYWTTDVNDAFDRLDSGLESAMREYHGKQTAALENLADMVQNPDLSQNDRQKLISLITIEVHTRDVVTGLIRDGIDTKEAFAWQSQLRYHWADDAQDCFINIADAKFQYAYEYLGNTSRLVITPLTDRCYITLTQSLHLIMGGAPSGPAGTGKTETTKDLGRGIGQKVYVFNCSEQMDYESMADIFKGLAQTGTWGCFDEFNRIAIEVLSVVSTQFQAILRGIQQLRTRNERTGLFQFMNLRLRLVPTCGAFITMNPGYKGRTALPENIKALFRPVAMIVPDLDMICEVMLLSEGFRMGKQLSKKFIKLYKLCQQLLSKQDHYDWGLRAIKSVLSIAGPLKRSDPTLGEDVVLMRALRDFNISKVVTQDTDVFLHTLNDLFPGMDPPVRQDARFEELVKKVSETAGLQADSKFIKKVVQLRELLQLRHSVFIIGPAGAGKSTVWHTLCDVQKEDGSPVVHKALNPKAVTSNELYGHVNRKTQDWIDGIFSSMMRNFSESDTDDHKWIVFDGDIDPEWIESLNSVMDDNKVLTLANNERIALTHRMRLLFEVGGLTHATPATVSRAGILFINEQDIGWKPFVESWADKRPVSERGVLLLLFERYVPMLQEHLRKELRHMIPLSMFNMVHTLCGLLDGLMTSATLNKVKQEQRAELITMLFVWAGIWAFGGALAREKGDDIRDDFNKWWRFNVDAVKLPEGQSVFDLVVDAETLTWATWESRVPKFTPVPDQPASSIFVPTVDTVRLTYLLNLLVDHEKPKPVMLVGPAGTGKNFIIREKLKTLGDDMIAVTVNCNSYTDAGMLQRIMEQPLERKAGNRFGPPGQKKLVYFVDDLNMPAADKYGTQTALALLRQVLDYGFVYDRQKLDTKVIQAVQYVTAMNPRSGSFTISERLQHHFATFACNFPDEESLQTIYRSILDSHLRTFDQRVQRFSANIVDASIELHRRVSSTFVPTAVKFHYVFSLRDLANVFQGVLQSNSEAYTSPVRLIRLWLHEATRVFSDRLITEIDIAQFDEMLVEVAKKYFSDMSSEELLQRPILFAHFTSGEDSYMPVQTYAKLKSALDDRMTEFTAANPSCDLVLFDSAMEHVARIARIIGSPRGNALLVGVGGSGKQSMTRLAAFVCGFEVFQITLTGEYGVREFRDDFMKLFKLAGFKSRRIVFMLTDAHIASEQFLVYVNDFLATGYVPDLFTPEEREKIVSESELRAEVKQAGMLDPWEYFVDKVRRNLRLVLCFSPVGDQFRLRCRKFPALINCSVVDWFHPWQYDALLNVASRFLNDLDLGGSEIRENIAHFMAVVHTSVNAISTEYRTAVRRYNYTTPKNFLDLIGVYRALLSAKRQQLQNDQHRLKQGISKLVATSESVADLDARLKAEKLELEENTRKTDDLIAEVGKETAVAEEKHTQANEERKRLALKDKEVSEFAAMCQQELDQATPIIQAAEKALDTLDSKSINEYKSLAKPTQEAQEVSFAVMILFQGSAQRDLNWNNAKKMMQQVIRFQKELKAFDRENIPLERIRDVQQFIAKDYFNPEDMQRQSYAAAGLCAWVVNMVKFHHIYVKVKPLQDKLAKARGEQAESAEKLRMAEEHLTEIDRRVKDLKAKYMQAVKEKNRIQQQTEITERLLVNAQKLVGGLSSNRSRWEAELALLDMNAQLLVGDVLLSAAFVSYIGAFNQQYRQRLVSQWTQELSTRIIPFSQGAYPTDILSSEADRALWNNEGLPSDPLSIENGCVISTCRRWPLLIDPQLQGTAWIRQHEAPFGLKVLQLRNDYLLALEEAVTTGTPVLFENLDEDIDGPLLPLVSRSSGGSRGKANLVWIGDKLVELHPKFRLYLQTKMANPHFKPEVFAVTTVLNFTVTEPGLEDQLLVAVVMHEKPELEADRARLMKEQNDFRIKLAELEQTLLNLLSTDEADILRNEELIQSLYKTKMTADEVEAKAKESKENEEKINTAREVYRPVATRGAVTFFLVVDLANVNEMYQYSLGSFVAMFLKSLAKAPQHEDVEQRLVHLTESVTYTVFGYVQRGLFSQHKLLFAFELLMRIMLKRGDVNPDMYDFLLRPPKSYDGPEKPNEVAWMTQQAWEAVNMLSQFKTFERLPSDIVSITKRWQEYCDHASPENQNMPSDWKQLGFFESLLVVRCLRPDRTIEAVTKFVKECLGPRYVDEQVFSIESCLVDAGPTTPVFFIVSPGVEPAKMLESPAATAGCTLDNGRLAIVALGQGQEPVAMNALQNAHKNGGWVLLENIHLLKAWLRKLQRTLEQMSDEGSHKDFQLFLSAEPVDYIPVSILRSSIKITNEPPQGLRANLRRAFTNFSDLSWENSARIREFKAILFATCFFHAVVVERRKFGPQGWNIPYPFNSGDLKISVAVLDNYLERPGKVPWDDLRYIFGEIMYGGHISDDWDRRLCNAYLQTYLRDELMDGNLQFYEGLLSPPTLNTYKDYCDYFEESIHDESPIMFGMHPNAQVGVRTARAAEMFKTVVDMRPTVSGGSGAGMSMQDLVKLVVDDVNEKLPSEPFDMLELEDRLLERTPYSTVFMQECERMNVLMNEMRRTLSECELGLRGDLQVSESMEAFMMSLYNSRVPESWERVAYPSMRSLMSWVTNFNQRYAQLREWVKDVTMPKSVWISGLFNPQAFLTALMQVTTRKNEGWSLDTMALTTDVLRKTLAEVDVPPRDGMYIHGLSLEGGSFGPTGLEDAKHMELSHDVGVVHVRALPHDRLDPTLYECPVYKTQARGGTWVFTAQLRSKNASTKWVLAGVALLMDIV